MSTAQTSTAADVARRLCRGYNEWIKEHGPDTDGARAEASTLTVVYDGQRYDVTIAPHFGPDAEMHRICGLLNCTDPEHLVLRTAREGQNSPCSEAYPSYELAAEGARQSGRAGQIEEHRQCGGWHVLYYPQGAKS